MSAVDAVAEALEKSEYRLRTADPRTAGVWSFWSAQAEAAIAAYESHLAAQGKVIVDRGLIQESADALNKFCALPSREWTQVRRDALRAAIAPPVEE